MAISPIPALYERDVVLNHSTSAVQAATKLAERHCDYPACDQLRVEKRDGSLHKKCEQHRKLQCEYQKNYMKRKRERSCFQSPDSDQFDGDDCDEPDAVRRCLPLHETYTSAPYPQCILGSTSPTRVAPMTSDARTPTCAYHKCARVCFKGRDNRFRSKCEEHLHKHRAYQRKLRKKSCSGGQPNFKPPREIACRDQHIEPTVREVSQSFETFWASEGAINPFGPMTMMPLEACWISFSPSSDNSSSSLPDIVESSIQLVSGWPPDVLSAFLNMFGAPGEGDESFDTNE